MILSEDDLAKAINNTAKAISGKETISKLKSLAVVADCTESNGDFVTKISSL